MQGRYRDSASAARLRAHPSVHARPRPQPAGLARRRVERDLYWVIDAVYQSAFLDDDEGVSGGFMTTTSRTAAQPAPGAARRGTHPGIALAVIAGAQLMVVLDATIVNIALPHIQQALHFSTTSLSWVLNAYTLTFGGLLLLGGRAGDILGRRRVFITGILVFTVASLLGGLATSSAWLLAARALQGVGGAIASPTALALITTNFAEGRERNRALGVFAAVSVSGAAMGLLAAFISIETRTRQPITPLHMFRNRNRAGSYAIMFALAAALFGMFFF